MRFYQIHAEFRIKLGKTQHHPGRYLQLAATSKQPDLQSPCEIAWPGNQAGWPTVVGGLPIRGQSLPHAELQWGISGLVSSYCFFHCQGQGSSWKGLVGGCGSNCSPMVRFRCRSPLIAIHRWKNRQLIIRLLKWWGNQLIIHLSDELFGFPHWNGNIVAILATALRMITHETSY